MRALGTQTDLSPMQANTRTSHVTTGEWVALEAERVARTACARAAGMSSAAASTCPEYSCRGRTPAASRTRAQPGRQRAARYRRRCVALLRRAQLSGGCCGERGGSGVAHRRGRAQRPRPRWRRLPQARGGGGRRGEARRGSTYRCRRCRHGRDEGLCVGGYGLQRGRAGVEGHRRDFLRRPSFIVLYCALSTHWPTY